MNAQTKHTPGPWYVEKILHGAPRVVYGETDKSGLRDDVPDTQENVRLKASAPELLGLLQELIDIEGPQPGTAEWADKVRSAIQRATGEQP